MDTLKKPDAATKQQSGLSNTTGNNYIKQPVIRKASKEHEILNALVSGKSLNRFQASRDYFDPCLNSTISTLRLVSDSNRDNRDPLILVDVGNYQVTLVKTWKSVLYGKSQKLFLSFRIVTEGKFYGQHITHCYNIKGINNRGQIVPKGEDSKFVVEYSHLFGQPRKPSNVGIRAFKGKVFNCSVRTVYKDFRQQEVSEGRRYSVIDRLIDVVANVAVDE